jgi:hypothetical protein
MTAREQTRTELLAALAELGRARPEWRLGQTLANVAMAAGRLDAGAVWDLEDDEALAAVRVLLNQYADSVCRVRAERVPSKFRRDTSTRPVIIDDVRAAEAAVRPDLAPAPLIR